MNDTRSKKFSMFFNYTIFNKFEKSKTNSHIKKTKTKSIDDFCMQTLFCQIFEQYQILSTYSKLLLKKIYQICKRNRKNHKKRNREIYIKRIRNNYIKQIRNNYIKRNRYINIFFHINSEICHDHNRTIYIFCNIFTIE